MELLQKEKEDVVGLMQIWFKQTIKISGINNIILTKLDVLDNLDEIKVCTGYNIIGSNYDYLPSHESMQQKILPIYETFQGWKVSTFGTTKWSDLPKNAQYIYLQ